MPTISLRLTDDQAAQLEEAARLSGQKVSVWMRAALTDALAGRDPAAQLKELAIIRQITAVTQASLHQYAKQFFQGHRVLEYMADAINHNLRDLQSDPKQRRELTGARADTQEAAEADFKDFVQKVAGSLSNVKGAIR